MINYIWLIPLIPLVGVVVNGLFGRRIKSEKVIAVIACGTVLASFILSVGAVYELAQMPAEERQHEEVLYDWIPAGVARLSDGQRQTLVLRFGEGLRYDEIAQALQCPLGTVKSRIYHGLLALRRLLEEESEEARHPPAHPHEDLTHAV